MGMIYSQRMLRRCDVVAQNQIQFIFISALPGNGGNGVVRFAVRFRINKGFLVRIAPPVCQNFIRQRNNSVRIGAAQTDNGHGPLHNACFHIFKACRPEGFLHRRFRHGKFIMTALEMVVA